MKFLPLLWSSLWRKKIRTIFTLLSVFVAFLLFGLFMTIRGAFSFGVAIAGPPDHIIEEVRRDQEAGADVFVFDLRARFEDYEELVQLIGEEILPVLRAGDPAVVQAARQLEESR